MVSPLLNDTITLLQELIRNACVNDGTPLSGQEVRNADTLERFLRADPAVAETIDIQRIEPAPGRVTLVATVRGDGTGEPLTYMGHTDVVPVEPEKWTVAPFGGDIIDGRIYGRGSMDMLFMTAAMAVTCREVARRGTPHGDFAFVGAADEEARATYGARWIYENEPSAFSWHNVISETGGSHLNLFDGSDGLVVVIGEKGGEQRRITVHGEAGHASNPYGRDSTVAKLGEVIRRLAQIAVPVSSDPTWQGYVRAFGFPPEVERILLSGGTVEEEREAFGYFGELARYSHAMSRLEIAPTVVNAGSAINVLPATATLLVDMRQLPGTTSESVDAMLRDALGDLTEDVSIEHLIVEPASVSSTDTALYRAMEDTLHEFYPDARVVPTNAAGGSDLRYARYLGGNGYGFGLHAPARTLGTVFQHIHAADEYVDIEDVDLTLQAYLRLAERFLW